MFRFERITAMRIALLAAAGVLLLFAPASAMAGERTVDESCDLTSEVLGYCSRVLAINGRVYFELESSNVGGERELCVKPPKAREECRGIKLRFERAAAFYLARVSFLKRFQAREPGTYAVRWLNPVLEVPLGKTMHFSRE